MMDLQTRIWSEPSILQEADPDRGYLLKALTGQQELGPEPQLPVTQVYMQKCTVWGRLAGSAG